MVKYKAFLYFFAIAIAMTACTINKTTQPPMNISAGVTLTPPAELLATPTQKASILPTPTQRPQEAKGLKYYWPSSLPSGLKIDPCASSVADDGFSFGASIPSTQLKKPGMHLKIAGGTGVHWVSYLPPCEHDYESTTVHGQKGCVNVDTDRQYIRMFWQEGEVVYVAIGGGIQFEDLLTIVETLEAIERDAFRQRLEPLITPTVTPSGYLVYYWPSELPKELTIDPENSSASEAGFVLELISPGNTWPAVIKGGSQAELDEFCNDLYEPGLVRGQQGFINMGTGAGFGVAWREHGHPYIVGGPGMSLAEVRGLAEALEPVDFAEWVRRLEQLQ